MLRRVFLAAGLVAALSACPNKDDAPVAPAVDAAVAAVTQQQNQRLAAVRDYALEGTVTDVASQATLRFRYAMQQPSFSAGELLNDKGERTRAFIFDGKVLAIVDDATKTIVRQDLSNNEEAMLLALHDIFSQFTCEGWRPPLLKPQGMTASRAGDDVVVDVPIADAAVASQRLTFAADGAFKKKEILDKGQNVVVSTVVVEDVVDAGTKLRFPKAWRHTEGGSSQEVRLTSVAVNAGVDGTRFSTAVPAGFAERSAP
jgi:hypothetical protein